MSGFPCGCTDRKRCAKHDVEIRMADIVGDERRRALQEKVTAAKGKGKR